MKSTPVEMRGRKTKGSYEDSQLPQSLSLIEVLFSKRQPDASAITVVGAFIFKGGQIIGSRHCIEVCQTKKAP